MSPYPVLHNRPIDQWKVTELKEELKRRKLTISGLKNDLIRRLDEALRAESESAENEQVEEIVDKEKAENEKEVDDGIKSDLPITSNVDCSETVVSGSANAAGQNDKNGVELDDARAAADVNEGLASSDSAVRDGGATPIIDDKKVEELAAVTCTVQTTVEVTTADMTNEVKESTTVEATVIESVHQNAEKQDNVLDNQVEDRNLKRQLESGDAKVLPQEDIILVSATTNDQVSEVCSNLGIQVKSDSVDNDSVSINEKNEYKGNITADNIKLEFDVKPASSDVVQAGGESHPMDVEEPHESKVAVEEKEHKNNSTGSNMNNEIVDLGYSEKLNLDRSSGDDSMEEDVPEIKHIDSKHNKDEVGNKKERAQVMAVKEETPVDILGDAVEKNIKVEKSKQSALTEKRKFNDGGNGTGEPVKRRRWKSENIKVSEPDGSNLALTTALKDKLQTPTPKRNFSRSDSAVSNNTPKELVVPPPQKPPTNSLRIDRFLRPFTIKAVQELLGKTGTVESFWMDHIKTHCYVTYSSVEEAAATRNAVYNLQWPPNGGNHLVAEFVEPEEVKSRLEPPAPAPASQPSQPPPPRQQPASLKQQLPPPSSLPPPPPAQGRERGGQFLPPAPLSEKGDPTVVTLDVLFRKTKATPRIYYLPLSEEQVAAKVSARGKGPRQW